MTNAVLDRVGSEIKRRREQVSQLRSELEDLEDYLDVLEARRQSLGKKTLSQADMKRRYSSK